MPIIAEVKSQELIPPAPKEIEKSLSGESEAEGENTTLNVTALDVAM